MSIEVIKDWLKYFLKEWYRVIGKLGLRIFFFCGFVCIEDLRCLYYYFCDFIEILCIEKLKGVLLCEKFLLVMFNIDIKNC